MGRQSTAQCEEQLPNNSQAGPSMGAEAGKVMSILSSDVEQGLDKGEAGEPKETFSLDSMTFEANSHLGSTCFSDCLKLVLLLVFLSCPHSEAAIPTDLTGQRPLCACVSPWPVPWHRHSAQRRSGGLRMVLRVRLPRRGTQPSLYLGQPESSHGEVSGMGLGNPTGLGGQSLKRAFPPQKARRR